VIPVPHFNGKTVAVFGLARSGVSAARALIAGGAKVVGWDDKADARDAAAKAGITVGDLNAIDWHDVAALILSPGVPLTHPKPHPFVVAAQAARTEIIGDVELFFRVVRPADDTVHPKIVCVTGTNGKSTTTALIGHLLSWLGYDGLGTTRRSAGISASLCWSSRRRRPGARTCWSFRPTRLT
jgi:UDP-N-acetylmuramoylalanine--D-glutamate ligase